jgi:hypothetical protein
MFGREQETAGNDFVTNFDSICRNLRGTPGGRQPSPQPSPSVRFHSELCSEPNNIGLSSGIKSRVGLFLLYRDGAAVGSVPPESNHEYGTGRE